MISPNLNSPDIQLGLAAEPLRALRRGISRAKGFDLYIAVVKTPAQRNQLIMLLGEALPAAKLQIVTISSEAIDVLDEIFKQLGDKILGPVMVLGLEDALSSDTENHSILNFLNLRRPDWPQMVPQPVVFWIPEYLLPILSRSAPDFLDWRSDTLHFPDIDPSQLQILHSTTWDGGMETQIPADARIERIKELESLIVTNENSLDPVVRSAVIHWLNELGLHLSFIGRTKEAVEHFEKLISLLHGMDNRKFLGIAFGNLGFAERLLGNTRKAIDLFEQQLKIAREFGDRQGEGNAIEGLAVSYKDLGETQKSLEFHNQAITIYREIGDRRSEARSINNLGVVYKIKGDLHKAVELYEQSLVIKRQIGDRRGEASCLGNLGIVYRLLGNISRAIGFLERALAIVRELGDRHGEAAHLGNLSVAYRDLGDLRKAIELQEQQLLIAGAIGDRRNEGGALWNSALLYDSLGDRSQAITRADAALKIYEAIEDPHVEMMRAQLKDWHGEV